MQKLLITGLAVISPLALAEVEEESPLQDTTPSAWQGEGDLAYNRVSGNSDTQTLLAKLKLIYARDRWTHMGEVEAVNSSESSQRTAEAYTLKLKSDFAISERTYGFGSFRYEDSRFSGYEYQSSVAAGLGVHLINDDITQFNVEGGLGYRASQEQGSSETLDEAILKGLLQFHRQLTETTRFETDLNVESGKENTFLESVTGLKVKINSSLALRLAYTLKHNSEVPPGVQKSDTLTSVGLNYSF